MEKKKKYKKNLEIKPNKLKIHWDLEEKESMGSLTNYKVLKNN